MCDSQGQTASPSVPGFFFAALATALGAAGVRCFCAHGGARGACGAVSAAATANVAGRHRVNRSGASQCARARARSGQACKDERVRRGVRGPGWKKGRGRSGAPLGRRRTGVFLVRGIGQEEECGRPPILALFSQAARLGGTPRDTPGARARLLLRVPPVRDGAAVARRARARGRSLPPCRGSSAVTRSLSHCRACTQRRQVGAVRCGASRAASRERKTSHRPRLRVGRAPQQSGSTRASRTAG